VTLDEAHKLPRLMKGVFMVVFTIIGFFDWVTLSLRFRVFVLVPVTFSTLTIVGEGVEQRESADRSRLSATTLWRNIARRLLEVDTYEAAEGR
jgi:hypothetical protein